MSAFSITYVPAVYIGKQPGYRSIPSMELFNLLTPLGDHPVGSTVCRRTLEKYGWRLLPTNFRVGRRPRGVKAETPALAEALTAAA